jgi:hypothetical protein
MNARRIWMLGVTLFAISATANAPKTPWPLAVLDKTRPVAEKILGTADTEEGDETQMECSYVREGFESVGAIYSEGKLQILQIEFTQDPGTWGEALRKVGVSGKGVKPKEVEAPDARTYTELNGLTGMPKKWKALFIWSTKEDTALLQFVGPAFLPEEEPSR